MAVNKALCVSVIIIHSMHRQHRLANKAHCLDLPCPDMLMGRLGPGKENQNESCTIDESTPNKFGSMTK